MCLAEAFPFVAVRALFANVSQSHVFPQAKEGNIEEGSAAWEDMSAQDQQRRKRGIEEMKMKLRSPNFFVSPLRLSVRNIPMTFSEAKLKQLMIQAVR